MSNKDDEEAPSVESGNTEISPLAEPNHGQQHEAPDAQNMLTNLGFDPEQILKALYEQANFGGPFPEGDLPPQLVSVFFRAVVHRAGPLPDPSTLIEYARVREDFPDRIVSAFERQTEHRQDLETTKFHNDGKNTRLGLIIGGILGFSLIVGGTIVIVAGKGAIGLVMIGLVVVCLIAAYRTDMSHIKANLFGKLKLSIRGSGTDLQKKDGA